MNDSNNRDWLFAIVDKIERFQREIYDEEVNRIIEVMLTDGWQRNASIESAKPMFPTGLKPKDGKLYLTPEMIGGLIGHTVAHQNLLTTPEVWDAIKSKLETANRSLGIEDHTSLDENPFIEIEAAFKSQICEVFQIAFAQSTNDQSAFFRGYAKAMETGSFTLSLHGVAESNRTRAYQLIAFSAPFIADQWKSIADVHKFLVASLGKSMAGDLDRTEKICKSLGLRLRNPGRPSKAE